MKGSSSMTNFKINNRTISLTSDQLLLTKQIAILGFASKSHINMLYSIIKGQQSLLSQHIFSKMVNKLHIWDSVSTSQKRNHTTITVYVLGRTGRSLLRMLHCFARDSQSFSINNHNMQATATLIQALYASYFKAQALGNIILLYCLVIISLVLHHHWDLFSIFPPSMCFFSLKVP